MTSYKGIIGVMTKNIEKAPSVAIIEDESASSKI